MSSNYAFLAPALRYGAQDLPLGRRVCPVITLPSIAFADAAHRQPNAPSPRAGGFDRHRIHPAVVAMAISVSVRHSKAPLQVIHSPKVNCAASWLLAPRSHFCETITVTGSSSTLVSSTARSARFDQGAAVASPLAASASISLINRRLSVVGLSSSSCSENLVLALVGQFLLDLEAFRRANWQAHFKMSSAGARTAKRSISAARGSSVRGWSG